MFCLSSYFKITIKVSKTQRKSTPLQNPQHLATNSVNTYFMIHNESRSIFKIKVFANQWTIRNTKNTWNHPIIHSLKTMAWDQQFWLNSILYGTTIKCVLSYQLTLLPSCICLDFAICELSKWSDAEFRFSIVPILMFVSSVIIQICP